MERQDYENIRLMYCETSFGIGAILNENSEKVILQLMPIEYLMGENIQNYLRGKNISFVALAEDIDVPTNLLETFRFCR